MAMRLVARASLKSALAATLVKDSDHYGAFELVFDIFFSGRPPGADPAPGPDAAGPDAAGPAAAGNGAGRDGVLAMLSDAELNELLLRAVAAADRVLIRAVGDEAGSRYAGLAPGRVGAGTDCRYRTRSNPGPDTLLA